MFSDESKYANV